MRSTRWRVYAALACITLTAAALRFWGLRFGLPQLTRPDEEAIVTVAGRVLRGNFNPGFFDYPTGFMYLVAAAERLLLGGLADPDDLRPFLIARVLSATLGTLSVPLLFIIVRRLYSTRAALIAAGLLAVAFLHVRDSHFGVTDVPMTFMTLLAFAAIVSWTLERPRGSRVLIAAVLCGLAASTKYNAAIIVVPLVIAIATGERRREVTMYLLVVAGVAGGFLAATPYAWLAREKFLVDVTALSGRMAADRHLDAGIGWVRHLTFSLNYGLSWEFLVMALAGAIAVALANDRRRAAVVLSFPIVYYVAIGWGHLAYMRYMLPIVPWAALSAAVLIDRAGAMHRSTALVIVHVAITCGFSTARCIELDRLLSQTDSRVLAADYIRSRFPGGVRMLQTGSPYGQVRLWPEGAFPSDVPLEQQPRLVVIQRSPLVAYSGVPPTLEGAIAGIYRLVHRVDVVHPFLDPEVVFDQEDAWFVPVIGFGRYTRPGPSIEIYERATY